MRYLLSASPHIEATIQLPASKGVSSHTLIIHALSKNNNALPNLLDCDDTKVMVKALTESGEVVDVLATETAMCFLTAYPSNTPSTHIIIGTEQMQQCPIQTLANALWKLGASIEYTRNEGFPPPRTKGTPLTGNEIILRGSVNS